MDASEKLVSLRTALNLSQEELADRIGVARQTVVSWEQGARPSAFNRRRICEEFALPLNYFDEDMPEPSDAENRAAPFVSGHRRRASELLRALGTVMRWGNVVCVGLLLFCAVIGIFATLSYIIIGACVPHVVAVVNYRACVAAAFLVGGIIALFYCICLFLRLCLREVLRRNAQTAKPQKE